MDTTYTVPAGNLFPVGTAKTRPEIYAMGFRQPFTLHTDPDNPGMVGMGEYCHDSSTDRANRSPAGTCEWNLINKAGQPRLAVLRRQQLAGQHDLALELRQPDHDGPAVRLLAGRRSRPTSATRRTARPPAEPTFDGLDTLPKPE